MINHRLLKKGGGGRLGPTLNPPMRAIDTVQKVEVHESHYSSSLAKRYLAGEHQVFFLEMCFCLFYLKKHRTSMFPYFKLMFKLSLVTTNTFLMHS